MNAREKRTASAPHRLQLVFAQEAYDRLRDVQSRTKSGTMAGAIRDAVRLLQWVLEKRDEGYEIALVQDGEVKKVVELIL